MPRTLTRTTPTAPAPASGSTPAAESVVALRPPTRRRPSWIAGGVVLVGLAALLGAYVFVSVSETTKIVVAARDLEPGEVISPTDLRVIETGGRPSFRSIPADQQSLIIGATPRSPIPQDTALNTSLFIDATAAIPTGQVVVGGSFSAGAVPTPSLAVGEHVQLFRTRPVAPGEDDSTTAADIGPATIWSVDGQAVAGSSAEQVWVSMLVDRSVAAEVVQALGNDQLRLVLTQR